MHHGTWDSVNLVKLLCRSDWGEDKVPCAAFSALAYGRDCSQDLELLPHYIRPVVEKWQGNEMTKAGLLQLLRVIEKRPVMIPEGRRISED